MSSDATNLELTAKIVAAYVGNSRVQQTTLVELIGAVSQSLSALAQPPSEPEPAPTPAVPVKRSVTPDYLISLEDGRKFKSLKRYLGTLGMTPADYRAKWNLPADYPMVAPNYAAARSELARTLGLGRKSKAAQAAQEQPAAKRRGRPRKTAA